MFLVLFSTQNSLPLLLCFASLCWLSLRRRLKGVQAELLYQRTTLVFVLTALTSGAILCMAPLWPHYFLLPLPFFVLLVPAWARLLLEKHPLLTVKICLTSLVVTIFISGRSLFAPLPSKLAWQEWPIVKLHQAALAIREELSARQLDGKTATIYNMYLHEARIQGYAELVSGMFTIPFSSQISAHYGSMKRGSDVEAIEAKLSKDPPVAILVDLNHDQASQQLLIAYAKENGFEELPQSFNQLTLFVRQSSHISSLN